jgi:hypothetical protein
VKILAILLIFSFQKAHSGIADDVSFSAATIDFVKTGLDKNCKPDDFINRLILTSLNKKGIDNIITPFAFIMMNCNENFNKKFKKLMEQDLLPLHQEKLNAIRAEITDFQSRNLPASFQMRKYLDYAKKSDVDGLILDPQVASEYEQNKAKFAARKSSCSDVMNLKAPLSLDKPKNQGDAGWCYAYAASDLVANATGKEPSAIYMSTLMNSKFFPKLIGLRNGGMVNWTINELIENGMCEEKDLPSSNHNFEIDFKKLLDDPKKTKYIRPGIGAIYNEITDLANKYKNTNRSDDIYQPDFTKEMVAADLCAKDNGSFVKNFSVLFPNLNMDQLSQILLTSWSTDAFKNIVLQSCPLVKAPELEQIKVKSSVFNIFNTINKQLDKGNIVAMNYDSSLLTDYTVKDALAAHSSTIVGRRFNEETMSCEYLLRNSWGQGCEGYNKDYKCKNGHVWIPEDFLKYNNHLMQVFYIEKK